MSDEEEGVISTVSIDTRAGAIGYFLRRRCPNDDAKPVSKAVTRAHSHANTQAVTHANGYTEANSDALADANTQAANDDGSNCASDSASAGWAG